MFSKFYDSTMRIIIPGKDYEQRQHYVNALELNVGDTVLDMAGGTGMNLHYLMNAVGKHGKIFAVDATLNQLRFYQKKVEYENIYLIQGDVSKLPLSKKRKFDAVLCTYAMCVIPDYETAIAQAVECLKPEGRLVIADIKLMNGWMKIFNPLYWFVSRSFVGPMENLKRPVKDVMKELGLDVDYTEFGIGSSLYCAVGKN